MKQGALTLQNLLGFLSCRWWLWCIDLHSYMGSCGVQLLLCNFLVASREPCLSIYVDN